MGGEGHSDIERELFVTECLRREEKAWKWRERGELGWNECRELRRKGHKRG